jgi:hypothetical protein
VASLVSSAGGLGDKYGDLQPPFASPAPYPGGGLAPALVLGFGLLM